MREADLEVLVEFVDPGIAEVPFTGQIEAGLDSSIIGDFVLTSPLCGNGVSKESLELASDII